MPQLSSFTPHPSPILILTLYSLSSQLSPSFFEFSFYASRWILNLTWPLNILYTADPLTPSHHASDTSHRLHWLISHLVLPCLTRTLTLDSSVLTPRIIPIPLGLLYPLIPDPLSLRSHPDHQSPSSHILPLNPQLLHHNSLPFIFHSSQTNFKTYIPMRGDKFFYLASGTFSDWWVWYFALYTLLGIITTAATAIITTANDQPFKKI